MKTKHEAVWEWLQDCPYIKNLFFNFSDAENGDTIIAPDSAYQDGWVNEYVDGTGEKRYSFSLSQYQAYSTAPNSTANINILREFEKIAQWVDEQGRQKNFPVFPPDETILDLYTLPSNTGYLALYDEKGAKYMLEIAIDYLKGEESI